MVGHTFESVDQIQEIFNHGENKEGVLDSIAAALQLSDVLHDPLDATTLEFAFHTFEYSSRTF